MAPSQDFKSTQPSQESALAITAQDCVLNFAPMTVTAPILRNAAIMDVDISALPCTQPMKECALAGTA
ncbi:hypothetical protein CgunFtcFv8_001327 [Champsocephalus gunnari]|uniref:Uncharacterized protein n=1 Tax=Champsocephalus gunnari TaxID=52237 RepID=A0AAN8DLG9_CHAGU|nr:hypothetical protein CgunFtcFv8_001327 [Champsocephalus gunnari]